MKFDFQSDIPLFQQVANQLEEEIFHEVYKEGDQVPSTTEISTGYQINPATVLKGMNLLVSEQILEKRRGLGTFVAEGARKIILSKKQNEFANQMVPNFFKEAQALGITKDELVKIIEGGFQ